MARVTVEDCLDFVDNRFELVRVASIRARALANGADPLLVCEDDKLTVIALREIAEGLVDASITEERQEVDLMDALVEELAAQEEERMTAGDAEKTPPEDTRQEPEEDVGDHPS